MSLKDDWSHRIREEERATWNREHVVVTPGHWKLVPRDVILTARWITFHADWCGIRGGTRQKKKFCGYSPEQEMQLEQEYS